MCNKQYARVKTPNLSLHLKIECNPATTQQYAITRMINWNQFLTLQKKEFLALFFWIPFSKEEIFFVCATIEQLFLADNEK